MALSPKNRRPTTTRSSMSLSAPDLLQSEYVHALQSRAHTATQHRFVAGTTFFNYEAFGSLRPDQNWIRLFSARHVGLAIHVTLCGFAFYFFSYGYGRLLAEYLRANDDESHVQAAHYVLVWPQALSLVIGLVSDWLPICGYRRKSYMVIGWMLSLAMYIVIIVMDTYSNSGTTLYQSARKDPSDSAATTYAVAYLLVSLVAAFGIQIAWLSAIALSVEYAQREQLHHRGGLQATLVTLYYGGGVIAQIVTASVISEGATSVHLVSTMSVGSAAAVLACVSALAIPFVLLCCHEEPISITTATATTRVSLSQRLKKFWRFCHQNVVYRVLFFIILHLFLVGLFNQNVRDAVQKWSRVTRREALVIEVARMAAMTLSIFVWRQWLRNLCWRALAFWGSAFYMAMYTVLTLCAVYDLLRNEWFYGVLLSLADVPRAWLVLYAIILATEIADIGHEGVTVALGMSYQTLAGLAGYTLAAIFPNAVGFKVSMDDVTTDSAATRANVIKAFFVVIAINLTSFPLIQILPQQKLDAQQMRAFGGYNRYASTALLLTFALLLCFNLAINLVVVL